jgi:hypothetical protein
MVGGVAAELRRVREARSESRVRERVSLREMRQGSERGCGRCSKGSYGVWEGDVAEDLGVRARWFTVVHGEAELTGRPHGAARENRRVEETVHRADETGPRGRDRRGARERACDWHRQPGPTSRGRVRRARGGRKPPRTGGAHLSSGAGAHAAPLGWSRQVWAEIGFLFFQGISIAFYFYFL